MRARGALERTTRLPEIQGRRSLSAGLRDAELSLESLFEQMQDLYEGVRSLDVPDEVQRFGETFVLREVVSDSLFPCRADLRSASINLEEEYDTDAEVVGPEEDFTSVFGSLFEFVIQWLIEHRDGDKQPALKIMVRLVRLQDAELRGLSSTHMAIAAREQSRRKGEVYFGECTVSWAGMRAFASQRALEPTHPRRLPLSNFALMAAMVLVTGLGGDLEFGWTQADGNFIVVRLPAP